MNPPLRSKDHYDRLWDAVDETLVSTIGSDHAPHTKEEKKKISFISIRNARRSNSTSSNA